MPNAPIGLALSGGGSRAAAFHRGTVRGLQEVGLLPDVDVVSTVSGGSIFAAAWMCAIANKVPLETFLGTMAEQLGKGFVARSVLSWDFLRLPFPGFNRTDLFAKTFDEAFFHGRTLGQLPPRPQLCLNTTVLNTGQVGKFTREGFQTSGRFLPGKKAIPLLPIPLPAYPLANAAIASAAFPIGLCPQELKRGREIPPQWGEGTEVEGLDSLQLTDGGVLENLGVQTLLKTRDLARWDLVVSDAGTREDTWTPSLKEKAGSAFMGSLSAGTLKGFSTLMNNKNDRHMRYETVAALEASWMGACLRPPRPWPVPGMDELLGKEVFNVGGAPDPPRRRKLLMVRVDQNWEDLVCSIPVWRLVELGASAADADEWARRKDVTAIEAFLASKGMNLAPAKSIYNDPQRLNGREGVARANGVSTNFTALSQEELIALHDHAKWQVHALKEVYW